MRPRLMMSTRSHTAAISGRMCELRMTVCSRPRLRMSDRVSMICWGSRPMVGSSRISTGGFATMACATPTRCL